MTADSIARALSAVAPNLSAADSDRWTAALAAPMESSGIVTANRIAAFIGQCAVESAGFTVTEENLRYSHAERLCAVWPSRFPTVEAAAPYVGKPMWLANLVYAGHMGNGPEGSGDGWVFRGSGLIQLTGRDNYTRFAAAMGLASAEAAAGFARTPKGAASSACWFWTTHGLNTLADTWSLTRISRTINGGDGALGLRLERCNAALAALR